MVKNNKGITLLTLVVTIVIMVIMIGIVGYYTTTSIKNSYTATDKKELYNIIEYVSTQKTKILAYEVDINDLLKSSGDLVISLENIEKNASGLNKSVIDTIVEVNVSDLDDNYKYLYVTAEKLNNLKLSESGITVNDVKNDYIINFYTGTIIGLYDSGKKVEISGNVKGLNDIINEI